MNKEFWLGLIQLLIFILLIFALANEYLDWVRFKPISLINNSSRHVVEQVFKETLVRPRLPSLDFINKQISSITCVNEDSCILLATQLRNLVGTEPRKLEIWYTTALLGALVTVLFAGLGYSKLRDKIDFREGYTIVFSTTIFITVAAIPASHLTSIDPAVINLILTSFFSVIDYQFIKSTDDNDEKQEFEIYLFFIDLPMLLASFFLVTIFYFANIAGNSAFSIGSAAGMLMLQSSIYIFAYVYLGLKNSRHGNSSVENKL